MFRFASTVVRSVYSLWRSEDNKESLAPGKFASLKNGKTHYIYKEPQNATTKKELVVLLHGASVFSFVWNRFAQLFLEQGHDVLTFDFYGHGYSDCPSTNYTITLFREQFEQLLDHLQLLKSHSSFILIGHSMGGLVASEFVSLHKEVVSKMVLLTCAGIPIKKSFETFMPSTFCMVKEVMKKTSYLDYLVNWMCKGLKIHGDVAGKTNDDISNMAYTLAEEGEYKKSWLECNALTKRIVSSNIIRFGKAFYFLYHSWIHQVAFNCDRSKVLLSVLRHCPLLDGDHSDTFLSVGVPTLIIWGESDSLLPKKLIEGLLGHMPHAEVLCIPGTDHAAFLQKPQLIFDTIVKFNTYGTLANQLGI